MVTYNIYQGYGPLYMELTLEAYRNIVRNVGSRADIATLSRVSKCFQHAAERSLYNTLHMRNAAETVSLCNVLAGQPRLAGLVDALTFYLPEDAKDSEEEEEEEEEEVEEAVGLPDNYWSSIARALKCTTQLRYLNIHIHNSTDTSTAWILDDCTFQLRSFHCDLLWDRHLVAFLNTQHELRDLFIIDYNDTQNSGDTTPTTNIAPSALILPTSSLPNLSILECTFAEAAMALVPGRPIARLKTCFSRSEMGAKKAELALLFSAVSRSTVALESLDIADASYSEAFSMELLTSIVTTSATSRELRYVGTLVLPIAGKERLQFYGLMMRLPHVRCAEVEVSEWEPSPSSPPAFRALASEMRLYSPTVTRVVFVHEFERTTVSVVDGVCRIDTETSTDTLWREI
ncbi:hypothetical protein BD779DRAFT_1613443 [Infundibulicybe gibba]|nr:hypothetical protein BD779DRAFT_1613443 [Infundibulicybe gibba]